MCGIAGIVSSNRTERIEEALVHQMCEAIRTMKACLRATTSDWECGG